MIVLQSEMCTKREPLPLLPFPPLAESRRPRRQAPSLSSSLWSARADGSRRRRLAFAPVSAAGCDQQPRKEPNYFLFADHPGVLARYGPVYGCVS
jgi:hypothetical protein